MTDPKPVSAMGSRLRLADGKALIDYSMDEGRVLAGYADPIVTDAIEEALLRPGQGPMVLPDYGWPVTVYGSEGAALKSACTSAARHKRGTRVLNIGDDDTQWGDGSVFDRIEAAKGELVAVLTEPFDSDLLVDEVAFLSDLLGCARDAAVPVVLDMTRGWGRVPLPAEWDFVVLGPSAAAGLPYGAVLSARAGARPHQPRAAAPKTAFAAARALATIVGPLTPVQTSGRAERLARGIVEMGTASGVEVRAVQPGGLLRLVFARPRQGAVFSGEMAERGVLAPEGSPWYPSLAHEYYEIEATIDVAAAAMAAAAAV